MTAIAIYSVAVLAVPLELYIAAYCFWQAEADPTRSGYWGWWCLAFLAIALMTIAGTMVLVIRALFGRRNRRNPPSRPIAIL